MKSSTDNPIKVNKLEIDLKKGKVQTSISINLLSFFSPICLSDTTWGESGGEIVHLDADEDDKSFFNV